MGIRFRRGLVVRGMRIDWFVRVCEIGGTRRMPSRVARREIGHIFSGVTRAGEASRRPYGETATATAAEILNFRFEISD